MKRKTPQAAKPQVTVSDYNWGSLYQGTKAQLIAARLATAKDFPKTIGTDGRDYHLPLDRQNEFMPRFWVAHVIRDGANDYRVNVEFSPIADMAIGERTDAAIAALIEALRLVKAIPPTPISARLGVKALRVKRD